MLNNRLPTRPKDYAKVSTVDHLAASRAQHFHSRENRPRSICDDEIDAVSDWSDSDRECELLSDFGSIGGSYDNDPKTKYYNTPFDQENQSPRANGTPLPNINDSSTNTQVSFVMEPEKPKPRATKHATHNSTHARQQTHQPLLPARRVQTKEVAIPRPLNRPLANASLSTAKVVVPPQARFGFVRENTFNSTYNTRLGTDSALSTYSILPAHDDPVHQRQTASPSFSQASIPRAYEIRKIVVGEYDYGRLTDSSSSRAPLPRNRQKWGTIVHPPFPLGYQQVTSEQVTQVVERLASPVRSRERRTPVPISSKRYLSIEETDALVSDQLAAFDWPLSIFV